MPTNNFLPFAPVDTGTNLLDQSAYSAASDRTNGNQPGVASSKLVNKALRQAAYISSQFAQYLADKTGADILDDATPAKLLAQINAAIKPLPVIPTTLLSGSGTYNLPYYFFIATGSATAAATYTNNGVTFTVSSTVASGVQIVMTGSGAPTVSGTLTKTSGTGDATLTFYAMRAPIQLRTRVVAGGGGGAGSGTTAGSLATTGGNSSFGTSLITCNGGGFGTWNGGASTGSTSVVNGPAVALVSSVSSAGGAGGINSIGGGGGPSLAGGIGGITPFGGASASGYNGGPTYAAATNSGSGGAGGGCGPTANSISGNGGGAGAYAESLIPSPSGSYPWAVGAKGNGGGAGANGYVGSDGGSGLIIVQAEYQ